MHRLAIAAALWLLTVPAFAQNGSDIDALLEAFFAKDLKSLSEHLPPELAEVIRDLPPDAREEVSANYLLAQQQVKQGAKITRPENGGVLFIERPVRGEESSADRMEIQLDKRMFDGNEVMLRFRPQTEPPQPWQENQRLTVWMKHVEDNWRVYELDIAGREIRLDDPNYLAYLKRSRPFPNEANAIGSLRTINTAVMTYSGAFPDVGFPDSLEALGLLARGDDQPDEPPESDSDVSGQVNRDHAVLLDAEVSSPPFEKLGYRFIYRRESPSEYTVAARPLQFGLAGTKNFFTDQSGVIRSTSEEREATVEDDPLQ